MSAKRIKKKIKKDPGWNTVEGELVAARLHDSPEMRKRYEQVERECKVCMVCGSPDCEPLVFSFLVPNTSLEQQGWWGTALCRSCYDDPKSKAEVERVLIADVLLQGTPAAGKGR